MRKLISSLLGGACAVALGFAAASGGPAPGAFSGEGPALANLGSRVFLAWAAEGGIQTHRVLFTSFEGLWRADTEIPGALTTTAPALGVVGQHLYVAVTPPEVDDKIYFYISNGNTVEGDATPLCSAATCAHTRATPALFGDGSTLYAAWTTPSGSIQYATLSHGSWDIATLPIPNAKTNVTTGPTLTVYLNKVYLAWVTPSGESISVASADLPLSKSSWSPKTTEIAAHTKVAPAISALTFSSPTGNAAAEWVQALFVAWTATDSTIHFASWESSFGKWTPTTSPVPLANESFADLPVALNEFTFETTGNTVECLSSNSVASTGRPNDSGFQPVRLSQITKPCPNVRRPGP